MRSNAKYAGRPADSPAGRCILCLFVCSLALGCEDRVEPASHQPDRASGSAEPAEAAEPAAPVEPPETAGPGSGRADASVPAATAEKGGSGTFRLRLSDAQKQLMLWTSSVSTPSFLTTCGSLFPNEKDRYEAVIAKWQASNELAIAKGEAQMRLTIASQGLDWDGAVERVAEQVRADTAELAASPRSQQKSACDLKLAILEDDL